MMFTNTFVLLNPKRLVEKFWTDFFFFNVYLRILSIFKANTLISFQTTVNLIKEGERVDASAATLLNMLNISPFTYGLVVQQVYDSGTVFEPKILDIKPEALRERFMEVKNFVSVNIFSEMIRMMKLLVRSWINLQTQKWENPLEAED